MGKKPKKKSKRVELEARRELRRVDDGTSGESEYMPGETTYFVNSRRVSRVEFDAAVKKLAPGHSASISSDGWRSDG